MSETNEQRMRRLADEDLAIVAIEQAIARFRSGEQSFRQTVAQIDQASEPRIVVLKPFQFIPEVQS
jgi:hypothetical protein